MLSNRISPNPRPRSGHPLLLGMTAFYPFRDGGGFNPREISGNMRHGTLTLTAATPYPAWVQGYQDKGGLYFNGANPAVAEGSYVLLPGINADYIPNTGGTISCWVRPESNISPGTTLNNCQGIVTFQSDTTLPWGLERANIASGGDKIYAVHNAGGTINNVAIGTVGSMANQGGWIHLIWQYDDTTLYGGLNGLITGSTASAHQVYGTTGTPKIGKGDARNFEGQISDVRIWSRVLRADELRWLYDEPDEIFLERKATYFYQNHFPPRPSWWHSTAARVDRHATPEITSHCEVGKGKLLQQFKQKDKIGKYICAFADSIQDVEQVLTDVRAYRSLTESEGVQLDKLGQNLVWPRNGYDDEKYRRFLTARTKAVGSRGRPNDLLDILTALDGGFAPTEISYTTSPPAACILHCQVGAGEELEGEAFARVLKPCAPATVVLILEFEEQDVIPFEYEENVPEGDPAPTVADSGFEDDEATGTGGIMAEAV